MNPYFLKKKKIKQDRSWGYLLIMHKTLGSISSYTQIVAFLLVIIILNFVILVMERGLHSCLTSPSL